MRPTIGGKLDAAGGLGKGFGAVRLGLASAILIWHGVVIGLGNRAYFDAPLLWTANYCLVPMFFALSGFLIAGSATRVGFAQFFGNRAFRIIPALAVEIALSAVLLGPILTAFGLRAYFADPRFADYFYNVVGAVQFELPGVLFREPYPQIVNGALWTVPVEMICYATMGALILSRLQASAWALLVLALAIGELTVAATNGASFPGLGRLGAVPYLKFVIGVRGSGLIPCFLVGLSFYRLRHSIAYDPRLFLGCLILVVAPSVMAGPEIILNPAMLPAFCLAWTYIVVFLGVTDLKRWEFAGDYSYGLYLYHFPIFQALASWLPSANAAILLVCGTTATALFAALSWHLIEKPILKARKSFSLGGPPADAAPKTGEPNQAAWSVRFLRKNGESVNGESVT